MSRNNRLLIYLVSYPSVQSMSTQIPSRSLPELGIELLSRVL